MTKKLSLYYDGYEALLNDYSNLEEFKILHKSTIHQKRLILILFFNFMYECKSQYKNVGLGQYKNVGFPTLLYCLF